MTQANLSAPPTGRGLSIKERSAGGRLIRTGFAALFVGLIWSLAASAGLDPANARGIALDKIYAFTDFDAINTFNGNLTLTIPIGPEYTVGDGLKYQVRLTYNSNVWEQEEIDPVDYSVPNLKNPLLGIPSDNRIETVPHRWFNAGLGWHVTFGELRRGEVRTDRFKYTYVSPDGASHIFYDGLHHTPQSPSTDPDVSFTRDGSYIRMKKVTGTPNRIVETPDGVQRIFACIAQCSGTFPEYRLTTVNDAFGNRLNIAVEPGDTAAEIKWILTESVPGSVSRRHEITFEQATLKVLAGVRWERWRIKRVDLAAFPNAETGGRAIYEFKYLSNAAVWREGSQTIDWADYTPAKSHIEWNKNVPGKDDYSIDVDLLEKVVFPAGGLEWRFAYYENREGESSQYKDVVENGRHPWSDLAGRLKTVILPSRGMVEYRYGRRAYPSGECKEPEHDPGEPFPSGFGRVFNAIGVIRRTEGVVIGDSDHSDEAATFYGGFRYDPFSPDDDTPCATATEFMAVVVEPMGKATVSSYSIVRGAPLGYEYGLPYARHEDPDAGGRFLSQRVYACSSSYMPPNPNFVQAQEALKGIAKENACGDAKRSVWVKHAFSEVVCSGDYSGPDCLQSNARRTHERTIYHDDGGVVADVFYDEFDGHGNFRKTTTDGTFAAANGTGTDKEISVREYNPGRSTELIIPPEQPWILSTYEEERKESPAGAVLQRAYFRFDAGTGFLTAKRTLAGTGLAKGDLLTTYERVCCACGQDCAEADEGGIVVTEKDYGGDLQQLWNTEPQKFDPVGVPQYQLKRRFRFGSEEYSAYLDATGKELLRTSFMTIDPNTGLVAREEDASGLAMDYTYDLLGRTTRIDPETQASVGYDYAFKDNLPAVEITRPAGMIGAGSHYHHDYRFDGFGRLTEERRFMPGGVIARKTVSYLPNGWKDRESTFKETGSAQHFTIYSDYDAFGRAATVTLPDQIAIQKAYVGVRITETTTRIQTSQTGKTEVKRWDHSDRMGRLVKVVESTAGGNGDLITRYDYDHAGRLVTVTQPGTNQQGNAVTQLRTFGYDGRGFMTSESHPELSSSAMNYKKFDARGHYTERELSGSTLLFGYDSAERLRTVALPGDDEPLKEFVYHDTNQAESCLTGKMIGRLERVVRRNWIPNPALTSETINVNVQEYYSYGNDGNVQVKTTSAAGTDLSASFSTNYGYDDTGQVTSIVYPKCTGCTDLSESHVEVRPTYELGLLTSIPGYTSATNGTPIKYHPNGLVAEVNHQNGVADITTIEGNGLPRPKSLSTTGVAGGFNYQFAYDGAGNVTTMTGDWFTYDGASRLKAACIGGIKQSFAYDQWGNLLQTDTYPDCSAGASANKVLNNDVSPATNRLGTVFRKTIFGTGQPVFKFMPTEYDSAGNVTRVASDQYDYDAFNLITHARTVAGATPKLGKIFLYDGHDERIAVVDYRSPGTTDDAPWKTKWLWTIRGTDAKVLREYVRVREADGTLGPWTSGTDYVYAGGRLLASRDSAGIRHYHLDHLGTPRLITDNAKQSVAMHTYFPFGEEISQPDQDASRMRFTGHERDNNNTSPNEQDGDLDYMHARYYSAGFGRFSSVDPAIGEPGDPQSWNRYAYVHDNPVTRTDPDGRVDGPAAAITEYYKDAKLEEAYTTWRLSQQAGAENVASQVRMTDETRQIRIMDNTVKLQGGLQQVEVKGEGVRMNSAQAGFAQRSAASGNVTIATRNRPNAGSFGEVVRTTGTTIVEYSAGARAVLRSLAKMGTTFSVVTGILGAYDYAKGREAAPGACADAFKAYKANPTPANEYRYFMAGGTIDM